jgi:hypothetical protein
MNQTVAFQSFAVIYYMKVFKVVFDEFDERANSG